MVLQLLLPAQVRTRLHRQVVQPNTQARALIHTSVAPDPVNDVSEPNNHPSNNSNVRPAAEYYKATLAQPDDHKPQNRRKQPEEDN